MWLLVFVAALHIEHTPKEFILEKDCQATLEAIAEKFPQSKGMLECVATV